MKLGARGIITAANDGFPTMCVGYMHWNIKSLREIFIGSDDEEHLDREHDSSTLHKLLLK